MHVLYVKFFFFYSLYVGEGWKKTNKQIINGANLYTSKLYTLNFKTWQQKTSQVSVAAGVVQRLI